MTSHLQMSKPKHTRLNFDLEKLKDPKMLKTFQAMIERKLALLTNVNSEGTDMDLMITTFSTAVTETASEILGKRHQKKKILGHCRFFFVCATKRRELRKERLELKDLRNTGR